MSASEEGRDDIAVAELTRVGQQRDARGRILFSKGPDLPDRGILIIADAKDEQDRSVVGQQAPHLVDIRTGRADAEISGAEDALKALSQERAGPHHDGHKRLTVHVFLPGFRASRSGATRESLASPREPSFATIPLYVGVPPGNRPPAKS